jgi:hypothetical protein
LIARPRRFDANVVYQRPWLSIETMNYAAASVPAKVVPVSGLPWSRGMR